MAKDYSYKHLTIRLEGLEEALSLLDPQPAMLAARASIERVANSGRGIAIDRITEVYNIKKSVLSGETKTGGSRITVSKPRLDNLSARITFSGPGISLTYFGAKQITGSRVMSRNTKGIVSKRLGNKAKAAGPVPQGVMVQVMKGGETTLLRNAFMAKMPSGHIGIFRRVTSKMMKSKRKQAIAEKSVVSIASMVENAKVMPDVIQRIQERWLVEFPRQLAYYQGRGR